MLFYLGPVYTTSKIITVAITYHRKVNEFYCHHYGTLEAHYGHGHRICIFPRNTSNGFVSDGVFDQSGNQCQPGRGKLNRKKKLIKVICKLIYIYILLLF